MLQAVEQRLQPLVGIELRVGDEPAGVVQDGAEEDLTLPAAGTLDVGAVEQVRLPDLITELRFELLVPGLAEQFPRGEAALLKEAVERGRRERGRFPAGRQGQFAQQRRASAMRVFAFQAFDQAGQLRRDGARLTAVLTRFGGQGLEAAVAVALGPLQQRVDGDRTALGIRDVILPGGNFLGAASEFPARKLLGN